MANFKISDIVSVVATPTLAALLEIEEGGVSGQTTVGGIVGGHNDRSRRRYTNGVPGKNA